MAGKTYLKNKNFFKRNYSEALKYILPGFLYEDDISENPKADDPVDLIINSHIDVADNFRDVLDVSAVDNTLYSGINTFSGITPYFVKQNELTNITTQSFEDTILLYFGKKFKDFKNSKEFESFTSSTLLPAIKLNEPDTSVFSAIGDSSAIHIHLINNLSWAYFLNTSGPDYNPSSYVHGLLVSSLFNGKPIRLNDGIKGLSEYLWKNASSSYYPSDLFASGDRSDLSGTQQLEKLKTWNDVIYSPLYADNSDFRVREKFKIYADNGLKTTLKIENGPFARLVRALSLFAYDVDNDADELSTLYDIDECPDEYLPLVAELIGWDLFGKDPARWRLQLRNAVSIYKSVGTKKSIQSTINTVFPKNRSPIESRIVELWESYIPYLIYYSLATNSKYFKNFESWTEGLSTDLGVVGYSTSSMDDNIRLAVDKILLEIIEEFPLQIPIKKWLDEESPVFNYRGRDYPIPPFEEYPYYINCELGKRQIEFLSSRLACFGCDPEFIASVGDYITSTALSEDTEIRLGSWLMFKTNYTPPPNINDLVVNPLNNSRFNYADLWCGKSSHFRISFSASEFNFDDKTLDDTNTGDAIAFISQSVFKRSPAHSIPIITLEIPAIDPFALEDNCLPYVKIDRIEIEAGAGANNLASGLYFNRYKRGINPNGSVFGREATQTSVYDKVTNSNFISTVPRNSSRRRSFEKIMPFNGYYDRTGFNMPVGMSMDSDLSGIPLGLVPSSLTYTPITSHVNVPDIWAQCENLSSLNSYYEYDVSNTQNCRGIPSSIALNLDRATNRGQLAPIYAVIHKISEKIKTVVAQADADFAVLAAQTNTDLQELEEYLEVLFYILPFHVQVPSEYLLITDEIERVQALLSSAYSTFIGNAVTSGIYPLTFPEALDNYYNFEFGRDLHRLYNIYANYFLWHPLDLRVISQNGANLFSHTFGPLLYNHDFYTTFNSASGVVTNKFIDPTIINVANSYFSEGSGGFTASSDDSMYIETFEKVSSGIIDGVELVLTSGTEDDSSFSVVHVPITETTFNLNSFLYDRTFILMRSGVGSNARIRFDLSKYNSPENYYIDTNFLIPDHKYSLSFDSLVSNNDRNIFGGRSVHVWLHTKPESGNMWSYTPSGKWVQHTQLPSREDVFRKYSHAWAHSQKARSPLTNCMDQAVNTPFGTPEVSPSPLAGLTKDDFETFTFNFDTFNRELILPRDYQKAHNQLHRANQEYVVEVLLSPGGAPDTYVAVENVKLQNQTMKKLSELFVTGTYNDPLCNVSEYKKHCKEYRIDLSKQEILDIFKYFNDISGKNAFTGYASRDKDITETIMESKGGSRIDYRYKKELFPQLSTSYLVTDSITIDV